MPIYSFFGADEETAEKLMNKTEVADHCDKAKIIKKCIHSY